ncbi:MAG TPA: chorismate synthase [Bacteroidales bacterium]|nr:chorismate synthase [Bacteroidales bacterium]HRT89768.1 chorismate synthase [Bacteroidales bacterium]
MNTFGKIFRVSLFGESHGEAVGVVIDGCPPGIPLSAGDFLKDLSRRKSGRKGTTPRSEDDLPEILSGIYNGYTTGSPVTVISRNRNTNPSDYDKFSTVPRPGHADFTSRLKFMGYSDPRGSGHFSGRITWGLVAAGVIAKKILGGTVINASLKEAGGTADIEKAVEEAMKAGDSIGGIVECIIENPPLAAGEPFFYSAESAISQAVFSIPAIKAIEFGAGFRAASMRGSEHNDPFTDTKGTTLTNNAGGINGGITNGNPVVFRVAVKPTSSVGVEQTTIDFSTGKAVKLKAEGRHDACIALRMPVIVEAAAAVALADLLLIDRGISGKQRS